ncbi:MAG: hypothetical protein K2P58_14590 [Hyphomonadaceae bacterium]|nr:hypothetical protein [Hyphomonadaceae bacterium]
MSMSIIPAIMSGGAGARLWPVSTDANPKQFHALADASKSLFVSTVERVRGRADGIAFEEPIVLCREQHRDRVRMHLAAAGLDKATLVLEPQPRNTAAVAVIAAALAAERDPDALVLLLPADHVIADDRGFRAIIARAAPFARERIITFGITPDRPATGYGYVKRGAALGDGVFAVDSFREKPDIETARAYLTGGGYSWNAGIFLFHPTTLLREFENSAEIRDKALASLGAATRTDNEIRLDAALFGQVPEAPIDTAVMEKTSCAAVAPCDIGWADIGAWDEIWRVSRRDEHGNAAHGAVIARDARNNLLRADGVTLCVDGVSDLIIVATPTTVIVLPRDRAQNVKALKEAAEKS